MTAFPSPVGGASLLLSFRLHTRTVVIIGSNPLAASRAFSALEADSSVVVIAKGGLASACDELKWRAQQDQITILDFASVPGTSANADVDADAVALDAYLSSAPSVAFVVVTDTLHGDVRRTHSSATELAQVCRARNIPVNVTDTPDLCDFSFTSTHRFLDAESGEPTSLQVGVTTNGRGCRLAGRVRRDIATKLPKDIGGAVGKIGRLRQLAKQKATSTPIPEDNEDGSVPTPNSPVPQRSTAEHDSENAVEDIKRRMKWVAQVSEYWPISRLAMMSEKEMENILDGHSGLPRSSGIHKAEGSQHHPGDSEVSSLHSLSLTALEVRGRILLVGSGPGHPSLLTVATHNALTKMADVVLSDKLVPDAVLALIPPHVEVRIARKFPGNADGAQNELMEAAIEAANKGLTVVRLKQGDPSVYGRAGEEVLYFRAHGYEPVVIPGVSSVLAGPTFAGIPVTQRGAAESFVVCTGVGRQGKEVKLPGYERGRTLVLLMGVARLPQILETLLSSEIGRRAGAAYPAHTPIALIERASMPDQRVIFSTLSSIAQALESVGEQRPPGMLVIGWSVLSLWATGDVNVLDEGAEAQDGERVARWLDGKGWRICEGLDVGWGGIGTDVCQARLAFAANHSREQRRLLFGRCDPQRCTCTTSKSFICKRVYHQRNILSTVSDIWATSSQSAFYALAKSRVVAGFAEAAVLRNLQGLTKGSLTIITPRKTYHFPNQPSESPSTSETAPPPSNFDEPKAEIVLKNSSFFLRLAASPDLGFAEAYMFGDIDVDTDQLIDIFRIFVLNSRTEAITSLTTSTLAKICSVPARLTAGRFVGSLQNAQPNISAHYDLGNDIFKAFLSRDMTYSCAIFPSLDADLKLGEQDLGTGASDDALCDAQHRKLRHVIAKADIRPGHRVLELGSGWGSLSLLIAETVEDTTIDTITLSVQQAEYVQEKIEGQGLCGRVRVHLMDYRAMPAEWQHAFDRVVSIEMIEAVGTEYYETYFAKIDWVLKKETGVAVIQGITIPEGRYDEYVKTEDFIRKVRMSLRDCATSATNELVLTVFPGGILPNVTLLTSAINSGSSGRLLIESTSNIGPHYARTLREWRRRFDAGFTPSGDDKLGVIERALREEFPDVMDGPRGKEEIEVFRRKWLYYFCYCEAGFTMRLLGVQHNSSELAECELRVGDAKTLKTFANL
ncbi:hypothetical protein BC835DRAFT_1309435 [Cytidiella melzeri]|nr:hypothetical protein BC835DRAFT_1309435 [Cytidiella melzeri]